MSLLDPDAREFADVTGLLHLMIDRKAEEAIKDLRELAQHHRRAIGQRIRRHIESREDSALSRR